MSDPSIYVSPKVLNDVKTDQNKSKKLEGILKGLKEDYDIKLGDTYVPLFEPFMQTLAYYKSYFNPLNKKYYPDRYTVKQLELAALGFRKCCEAFVKLGMRYNIKSEEMDHFNKLGFREKLDYLDINYPDWKPRKLHRSGGEGGLTLQDFQYFLGNKLMNSKDYENRTIRQLNQAGHGELLFESDALKEAYKTASYFIHLDDLGISRNDKRIRLLVKNIRFLCKVISSVNKSTAITVNNACDKKEVTCYITSVGGKNKFLYRWFMSVVF